MSATSEWVLLFHYDGRKPDHFDLMIEQDGVLKTWSTKPNPMSEGGYEATVNFDHPMKFLSCEGKLSEGNGFCRRVDWGTAILEEVSATRISAVLENKLGKSFQLLIESDQIEKSSTITVKLVKVR